MPPIVIAGAIAGAATLGGAAIGLAGANKAADAAREAGNAQLTAAREEIAAAKERQRLEIEERRRTQEMAMAAAVKSPTEIAAIDRIIKTRDTAYAQQKAQLDKQFALLEAADPAIKEAGTQLYGLMKGESTKMLTPVMKSRELARQKLEAQLARTLGPSFRTTSAGISALTKFDLGTDALVAETQQKAIETAQNVFSGGIQLRNQSQGAATDVYRGITSLDTAAASIEQAAKARETNAVIGATSAAPVNYGAVQDATRSASAAAGAPFAGDILGGQAAGNFGGAIMNIGANLGGQILGNQLQGDMLRDIISKSPGAAGNYGGLTIGGNAVDTNTVGGASYGSMFG